MQTLDPSREAIVHWPGKSILLVPSLVWILACGPVMYGQGVVDQEGETAQDVPAWADIVRFSGSQVGRTLTFVLETRDSIPRKVEKPCKFEILLRTEPGQMSNGPTAIIAFDLGTWDGSPWFATNIIALEKGMGLTSDTVRMFDWKLGRNSLTVRFSLEGLGWSSVKARGQVSYRDTLADLAPDDGWVQVPIDTNGLQSIRKRSSSRAVFSTPERYDSVLVRYDVLPIVDAAYEYELELTGITPLGGDSVRFIFNPFYNGAAIEGDPIYLGPGMCGTVPLWFVYFHEMGHNYINASARFRQLYPLEMRLEPGPLPTHILFYEGWASLPAMYVFDRLEKEGRVNGVDDTCLQHVLRDWKGTKARFLTAWEKYKQAPAFTSLNPDVVDGMFLELVDRFGWGMFKEYFRYMRPADQVLPLFDTNLDNDTRDLRATRSTLTAACLSAAAGVRLDGEFKKWAFPIDDILFTTAYESLTKK